MIAVFLVLALALHGAPASAQDYATRPIMTDSRIKTLIYNENDVFRIVTHYGYQSNIEFGPKERIMTISVGDQSAWQIIPAETHLFIRALAERANTNMTVITDKHIYQFDLHAYPPSNPPSEELAYVVRFYYPDEQMVGGGGYSPQPINVELPSAPGSMQPASYNYQYSLTGPNEIAPVKVFDNGVQTYFQFAGAVPEIFAVDAQGREQPVTGQVQGGYVIINQTASQFSIREDDKVVCVFNERAAPRF